MTCWYASSYYSVVGNLTNEAVAQQVLVGTQVAWADLLNQWLPGRAGCTWLVIWAARKHRTASARDKREQYLILVQCYQQISSSKQMWYQGCAMKHPKELRAFPFSVGQLRKYRRKLLSVSCCFSVCRTWLSLYHSEMSKAVFGTLVCPSYYKRSRHIRREEGKVGNYFI